MGSDLALKKYGWNTIHKFVEEVNSDQNSLILIGFDSNISALSNHVLSYEVSIINKDGKIHQLLLNAKRPNFDSSGRINNNDFNYQQKYEKYQNFNKIVFNIENELKLNETNAFVTRGKLRISPKNEIFSYLTEALPSGIKYTRYPDSPKNIIESLVDKITSISYLDKNKQSGREEDIFTDIKLDGNEHLIIKSSKSDLDELLTSLKEGALKKNIEIKDVTEDLNLISYAKKTLEGASDINAQLYSDYVTIEEFQDAFEKLGGTEIYVHHRPYGAGMGNRSSDFTNCGDTTYYDCVGLIYERSFVDSFGVVHTFSTVDRDHSLNSGRENMDFSSIYNFKMKRIQGIVFQKDGKTTHLFIPDYESHQDPSCGGEGRAERNSFEQWLNALKSSSEYKLIIDYAKTCKGTILIASHGENKYIMNANHLFTSGNFERSIDEISDSIKGCEIRDQTDVYRTIDFIMNSF